MFDPTQLFTLSESEQAQSNAVEALMTEGVATQHEADPTATVFKFNTTDISKEIKADHGGLKTKVRTHVIDLHKDAKWKVNFDETTGEITLTAKKPRAKKADKVVDVVGVNAE